MDKQAILTEQVTDLLDQRKMRYSRHGDRGSIIQLGISLPEFGVCQAVFDVGENDIHVLIIAPQKAIPAALPRVAELITRANYGMKVGGFELDYDDGEVRFRHCLICVDGIPGLRDIDRALGVGLTMMARYGKALRNAMVGLGDPAREVAAVENGLKLHR